MGKLRDKLSLGGSKKFIDIDVAGEKNFQNVGKLSITRF